MPFFACRDHEIICQCPMASFVSYQNHTLTGGCMQTDFQTHLLAMAAVVGLAKAIDT